jgi:hypothetical protein
MTGLHGAIPLPVHGAPTYLPDRPSACLPESPLVVVVFLYHLISHGHLFGDCQVLIGSLVVFLVLGYWVNAVGLTHFVKWPVIVK